MSDVKTYGVGFNFGAAGKFPVIAKRIWQTYAEALEFANDVSPVGTAVQGLTLSVTNDSDEKKNGLYRIVSVATSVGANDAVLEKIGSGKGTLVVGDYRDAVSAATADNVGQMVYTMSAWSTTIAGSAVTYPSGAYVVNGLNTVSKLAETTASGDYGADIRNLQGRMTVVENKFDNYATSADTEAAIKVVDDKFANYATSADTEAAIKVVDDKFANYATSADTVAAIKVVENKFDNYATSADTEAAIKVVDDKFANYATSADTEAAILAAASASVVTVEKLTNAESGYAASYIVKQNGEQVGATINIPKDFLVKSAQIKTCVEDDKPVVGYKVGDKYIDFVINTKEGEGEEQHIYLKVQELVDVYSGSTYISVDNYVISLKYDGLKAQLSTDLGISDLATKAEVTALSAATESAIASATQDKLSSVIVNGHSATTANTEINLNAGDVKVGTDLKHGEDVVYSANTKVDSVLQGILNTLNDVKEKADNALSAITADGSGVTIANGNEVKLKFEQSTSATTANGHIEIKVNDNGELYGVMYYLETETE